MTAAFLVLIVVLAFGTAWVSRWLWREGFRQGDLANDPSTSVDVYGAGKSVTVRTTIVNPQSAVVMTAIQFSEVVGRRPLAHQGRSTLKKPPDLDGAELRAIDASGRETIELTVARPTGHRSLVVDVYLWQPGDRVRLHRHVCGPGQPDPAISVAGQRIY
jgi:hypothetical protein